MNILQMFFLKNLNKQARKVREWAIQHEKAFNNLSGWCAICSFKIFEVLKSQKLDPEFCIVNKDYGSHCFVICKDYLIDVTATQFGVKQEVFIKKLNQVKKRWFWDLEDITRYKNKKDIMLELNKWPSDQDPFRFEKNNKEYMNA